MNWIRNKETRKKLGLKFKVTFIQYEQWSCVLVFECLYFLCDVKVAGVDAVREQILCAAALTRAKHTVVGLEQLTAGRRAQFRERCQPKLWR